MRTRMDDRQFEDQLAAAPRRFQHVLHAQQWPRRVRHTISLMFFQIITRVKTHVCELTGRPERLTFTVIMSPEYMASGSFIYNHVIKLIAPGANLRKFKIENAPFHFSGRQGTELRAGWRHHILEACKQVLPPPFFVPAQSKPLSLR